MTTEGILDVIEVLTVTYDNYHPDVDKTVKVWQSILKNFNDDVVKKAIEIYIITDTSGFAPKIGQIIDKIRTAATPDESEMQAWGYVSKALRNSIYGSKEEFEKLPDAVKEVVGDHEQLKLWATMDVDEVQSVVSSNFMRSYRARVASKKDKWAVEGRKQERISQENLQAIPK